MIRYQDKLWGEPRTHDWEGDLYPLTPAEVANVPRPNELRMYVHTYDDHTQELSVDMDSTYLSQRFPRCRRVLYRRVIDPSVAIPFLMGGDERLGANSPVQPLDPDTLRLILQLSILHYW